ncbi:MAG TPA: DUF3857 domain-containing protein, partial [Candidatus Eisenbacteria bacterium]|nr:DUF3857 domain-containing protein [Candidatus Eisenbacteria bacterium]
LVEFWHAFETADAKEVLGRADALVARSLDSKFASAAEAGYLAYDQQERLGALRALRAREGPVEALQDRIGSTIHTDLAAAHALIDSLRAARAGFDYGHLERQLREAAGDTVAFAELDSLSAAGAKWECTALASLALNNGNPARARRLWDYADRRGPPMLWQLQIRARAWMSLGDSAYALAAVRKILDDPVAAPAILPAAVGALVDLEGRDAALDHIRSRIHAPDPDPDLCLGLAPIAQFLNEAGLADTLLAIAAAPAPQMRTLRITRGWIHAMRGDRAGARRELSRVLEEQPGRKEVAEKIASLEGTPSTAGPEFMADPARDGEALNEDLEKTDWIVARSAAVDSLPPSPFAYVALRRRFVCESASGYETRDRTIVKIRTEDGVDAWRVYRIGFQSSDGAPRVLVARVIQPDGTVQNVNPSEMVVGADPDADADVSESRFLMIPMPGVKPGTIVDVAHVASHRSPFGNGWSWMTAFAQFAPTLESTIEIQTRPGLPVTVRFGGGAPEPQTFESRDRTVRKWTLAPVPEFQVEQVMYRWLDRVPWIGASTYPAWDVAAERYRDTFWKQIELTSELKSLAARLVAPAKTPEAKVDSLMAHVSRTVSYVAIEIEDGRVIPTPAREVARRGYGDCKGMSALLIALCEAAGLEAWPALVPFGLEDPPRDDLVHMGAFSHMIVYLPGVSGGSFRDPTGGVRCGGGLPANVAGTRGLVFGRKGPARLVEVPPPDHRGHGVALTMDVKPADAANQAEFVISARFRGDPALMVQQVIQQADTNIVNAALGIILGQYLPATCRRIRWSAEPGGCGTLTLNATYRDTLWSDGGNEVRTP